MKGWKLQAPRVPGLRIGDPEPGQEWGLTQVLTPTRFPHTCPVCQGRGVVGAGFYSTTNTGWSTNCLTTEPCRSCEGRGIVWQEITKED